MVPHDKVELARRLYIEQGRTIPDIAMSLDVAIFVLAAAKERDDWDKDRALHQSKQARLDPEDTTSLHNSKIRQQFLILDELIMRMNAPDITPSERRQVKDSIEAVKWATEALTMIIDADRKVRGIKPTAPSVRTDDVGEQGIRYLVKRVDTRQQAANS